MVVNIRLSTCIIMVIFFVVGHSFQKIRADYAPEKMPLDDEARQEMRLEPRSFIPHPRPNRADISTNDQAETLTKHRDEFNEKHVENSGHEDEEEVIVKDDEGSSTGSGEASNYLSSHEETSSQNQRKVLSTGSLADEHMKGLASPVVFRSPESKAMSKENENQSTNLVTGTPHVIINHFVNNSSQNETKAEDKNLEKTVGNENEEAKNESPVSEDEVENEKNDRENTVAHQEGSAVASMDLDEEPKKGGGSSKEDVGDALKLGLKTANPQTKDKDDTKENKEDDDESESGSGIDGEKTRNSHLNGEEKNEKTEDKNTKTEDRKIADHSNEDDKIMKDSDENDDDSVDKEDDDHDNTSGSAGDVLTKQTESTPNVDSTKDQNTNNIDKTAAKEEDEEEDIDEDNEKEDKMEDAIKGNEEVDDDDHDDDHDHDDEDEDEENESQIEIKEPKELEPGTTSEANQTAQQSTVHKLANINVTSAQNSSKESRAPIRTQEQIHELSTIHKVKNVQKLENGTQKTRKIPVQHSPVHSEVHTEKNVENSKALKKKHDQRKKAVKQAKVGKATHTSHHDVKLKHHEVKHKDKTRKKPRKSKSLLKYIHRPNLHKKKTGVKLNKPPTHKCNSDNIKTGYSLKGGTRAGHVEDLGESAGMHECIQRCCHKKVCDVALMLDGRCFGVACYSKELCEPVMVPHPHFVNSQIAFLDRAQRRDEVGRTRSEFDCKYGELKIRNNHRWSGELCGGVVTCRNGVVSVEKCPDVPDKPTDCANPKLVVQQRPGQCCIKKWICKDKSCEFGKRRIPHGVSLSDQLCTGVVKCMNGHLQMKECPKLPEKPTSCAHPKLKITTVPGQCCKKRWICPDKSCSYGKLKVDDGERLTDASCAVVMECKNGFLNFKQCPNPPPVPSACLNPTLKVKRILGECCHMKWACAQETK